MTARRTASARAARVRERAPRFVAAGPVVVDASIAVSWFANEPDRWGGERLLDTTRRLLAPEMMAVEATNAWWKKHRRREMASLDVEEALTNLLALEISWTSSAALLPRAARLAIDLGHPVCDCLYLALAASESASLASADDRLRSAAERLGIPLWSAR